jgi:hypothetical protein
VSVTQTHQGLGGFTLALRPGGAANDYVARLNPWDHLIVTPKGLGPQPDLASIKATSVFSGRIDQVDIDGGAITVGGPSIAVWLGDEAGRGKYPDAVSFPGNVSPATWLGEIFTRAGVNVNGLTSAPANWQNLQTGTITWQLQRFVTVRQSLDELASLCDRPFEWLVRPSGEIFIEGWVGANIDYTRTIFSWFPEVLLADGMSRTDGVSTWTSPQTAQVPLQVFPADIAVSWDFTGHAARGIARGNGSPAELRSTGTNKNDFNTNGFGFNPANRIGWDTIVDFDTNETGVLQAAANSVGRLASIRREWTVSAGSSELVAFLKPGDYVWINADQLPGIGAMTYAEEAEIWAGINAASDPAAVRTTQAPNVSVGGAAIYPARARVESMTWPCSDRWDYWHASTWDGTGDVRLINDLIDYDPEGPVSLDVNGTKPRWQMQRKVLGSTISRSFNLQANDKAAR